MTKLLEIFGQTVLYNPEVLIDELLEPLQDATNGYYKVSTLVNRSIVSDKSTFTALHADNLQV